MMILMVQGLGHAQVNTASTGSPPVQVASGSTTNAKSGLLVLKDAPGPQGTLVQNALPTIKSNPGIEFAVLGAQDLATEYSYLLRTLPQFLAKRLSMLPERVTSDEQYEVLGTWALEQVRASFSRTRDQVLSQRDIAALLGNVPPQTALDLGKKLAEAEANLAYVQALGFRNFEKPQAAPFMVDNTQLTELVYPGNGMVPSTDGLRTQAFALRGSWYRVAGVLSNQGDFFQLRLVLDDCIRELRLMDRTFGFSLDEVQNLPGGISDALATAILSYVPARLEVQSNVDSAQITLEPWRNGGQDGVWQYLPPGEYAVSIRARSYLPWQKEILVEAGRVIQLRAELQARASPVVRIRSNVPATVWEGANYLGATPYDYEIPESKRLLVLRAPGHLDQVFILDPASAKGEYTVQLFRDGINFSDELVLRRDQVYESLGWFVLSLALPVIADGLLNNETQAWLRPGTSNSFRLDLAERGMNYYYLRNVGYAISSILLVNVFMNISDYMETASNLDFGQPMHREN